MSTEDRIKELERRIEELENPCKKLGHKWETVGGVNSNYVTYFNMCNAYIKCERCGQRQRV